MLPERFEDEAEIKKQPQYLDPLSQELSLPKTLRRETVRIQPSALTKRQTLRQTHRHTDSWTERQTDRHLDTQADGQIDSHSDGHIDIQTDT